MTFPPSQIRNRRTAVGQRFWGLLKQTLGILQRIIILQTLNTHQILWHPVGERKNLHEYSRVVCLEGSQTSSNVSKFESNNHCRPVLWLPCPPPRSLAEGMTQCKVLLEAMVSRYVTISHSEQAAHIPKRWPLSVPSAFSFL